MTTGRRVKFNASSDSRPALSGGRTVQSVEPISLSPTEEWDAGALQVTIGAKTRGGQSANVVEFSKRGMSAFPWFGTLNGKPCHWTSGGKFRMDGQDDPRDLVLKATLVS